MVSGIKPTVDYVFKYLFGRERNLPLLVALLNAILGLTGGSRLVHLEILNPFNDKERDDDKLSILDIRARSADGRLFLIEMQMLAYGPFRERVLYYWAKSYQEQMREGVAYNKLRPAVSICFVDTPLFPELPGYHRVFDLRERESGVLFTDQLQVHILELSKFTLPVEELTTESDVWMYFLRHGETLDSNALPPTLQLPEVRKATGELEMIAQSEIERERYESRLKSQRDFFSMKEDAIRQGRDEGWAQGVAEGKAEGISSALIELLKARGESALPVELEATIQLAKDLNELRRWYGTAIRSANLDEFRRDSGI